MEKKIVPIIIKSAAYVILSVTFAFVLSLIRPLFPTVSDRLDSFSMNIMNILGISIQNQIFSTIIAVIFFIMLYSFISYFVNINRKVLVTEGDNYNPSSRETSIFIKILRIVLMLVLLPVTGAYFISFLNLVNSVDFFSGRMLPFLFGFILFGLLWIIILRKRSFFYIFEHEFTHMVVALLFFRRPKAFYVQEDRGGWVQLVGSNFIIALAPYFLLTFCFLWFPFYFLFSSDFHGIYFIIMGALVSYHTFSTIKEMNFRIQPDIIFNGRLFSLVIILLGNIINYGFVIAFVYGGVDKVREFFIGGFKYLMTYIV